MAETKKNLPNDFGEIMKRGDFEEIKAVFRDEEMVKYLREVKEVKERSDCPFFFYSPCTEIYKWFAEQGFDIHLVDKFDGSPIHRHAHIEENNMEGIILAGADIETKFNGSTPLQLAARTLHPSSLSVLIRYGADVHVKTALGKGALELVLGRWDRRLIPKAVKCMELLINAGVEMEDWMKDTVIEFRKDYDKSKDSIHTDDLQPYEEAITHMCELFGVARTTTVHDGKSLITVTSKDWRKQHEELWNMLVPEIGKCKTVQGEVVRIGGRINYEIFHQGGVHWDKDFRKMLNALKKYYDMGNIPDEEEHQEALALIKSIGKNSDGDDVLRLCEINIHWVLANPKPILLGEVNYNR